MRRWPPSRRQRTFFGASSGGVARLRSLDHRLMAVVPPGHRGPYDLKWILTPVPSRISCVDTNGVGVLDKAVSSPVEHGQAEDSNTSNTVAPASRFFPLFSL